jgi:hypothetical protein
MTLISSEKIQSTPTYQKLSHLQQHFAIKRHNRESITNALNVHKSTGTIPATVQGSNIDIVKELIEAGN